jgi:ribosome-associated translation inhibitor RaiA
MNLTLRYHGLNTRAFWQGLVEAQLKKLGGLVAIASARVTLDRQHEVKPAFRVQTPLEVPRPDFHAEASDYTLQAALLKVVKDFERQIRARRVARWRSGKGRCDSGRCQTDLHRPRQAAGPER